jgi:DNA (cytosine-5)-methyltransferase 1
MGLDLGLESAGWKPSLAVEIEPVFCRTIRRNRPEVRVLEQDIAELSSAKLAAVAGTREADLFVGGPPCQSFSTGGNRAALNDPRGNAIFEYLRLVSEVRPKMFVLENVANIVTAAIRHRPINQRPGRNWNLSSYSAQQPCLWDADDGAAALQEDELSGSAIRYLLRTVIADLNYNVRFAVLNSADYGAPQKRLRFVMIGSRDGLPPRFVRPTHGTDAIPFFTVRDAIGDLESNPGPGFSYLDSTKRYFALVPPGGNWRDLPPEVAIEAMGERSMKAGGGKTGFFRRLSWEGLSPTITGKPNRKGSAMCHPSVDRPLSVRECARLQGFPDGWTIQGSVADQYQQIGNAVPVALGRAIGLTLLENPPASDALDPAEMLARAIQTLRASARNTRSRETKGAA